MIIDCPHASSLPKWNSLGCLGRNSLIAILAGILRIKEVVHNKAAFYGRSEGW